MLFQLHCLHPNSDPWYVWPRQDNYQLASSLSVLCPRQPAHHHQGLCDQKNHKSLMAPVALEVPHSLLLLIRLLTENVSGLSTSATTHALLSVQCACFLSFLSWPSPASPTVVVTSGARAMIFHWAIMPKSRDTVITQGVSAFSPQRAVFIQILFSHVGKQMGLMLRKTWDMQDRQAQNR